MNLEIKYNDFINRMIDNINKNPITEEFGYKAELRNYCTGLEMISKVDGCPTYNYYMRLPNSEEVFNIGELIKFNFHIREQLHLTKNVIVEGSFEESDNLKYNQMIIKRLMSEVRTLNYNLADIKLKDISYHFSNVLENDGESAKESINDYNEKEIDDLLYPFDREHFYTRVKMTNVILCALIDTLVHYLTLEILGVDGFIVEIYAKYDTTLKEDAKFKRYNVKVNDLPIELRNLVKLHPDYDVKTLILDYEFKDHTIKLESKVEGYSMEMNHKGDDLHITIEEHKPDSYNEVKLNICYIQNLDFLLSDEEFVKLIDNTIEILNKKSEE